MLKLIKKKFTLNFKLVTLIIIYLTNNSCSLQSYATNNHKNQNGQHKISLTPSQKLKVGKKIWQHECNGTIEGLTSWNKGENFASLGIGHFIWFPPNINPPFQESFPTLISFMKSKKIPMPNWLTKTRYCPWTSKKQFYAEFNSPKMRELRNFLKNNIEIQTDFLILRLSKSLNKMKNITHPSNHNILSHRFYTLLSSPEGTYAMIDYVNFKGEGVNQKERYQGTGWGLLQVLKNMNLPMIKNPKSNNYLRNAVFSFSDSAKKTLAKRISIAPKKESQWAKGWFKRCESYKQNF